MKQPERTRDMYMAKAREARTVAQYGDTVNFGVIQFYRPVSYYVSQARRANRKLWIS